MKAYKGRWLFIDVVVVVVLVTLHALAFAYASDRGMRLIAPFTFLAYMVGIHIGGRRGLEAGARSDS